MLNTVTIIGDGPVGMHLGQHADAIVNRQMWKDWLANVPEVSVPEDEYDVAAPPLIILAVPETALEALVEELLPALQRKPGERVVVHTSGVVGIDMLVPLRSAQCAIGLTHPFQTFGVDVSTNLENVGWGVECDDAAWPVLFEWIEEDLGGVAYRFKTRTTSERLMYHAAAVAASNLTYASLGLARSLAQQAGIPPAAFIMPILEQTVENVRAVLEDADPNVHFPITGPLARGNTKTVLQQMQSIPVAQREVYALLSLALLNTLQQQSASLESGSLREALLAEIQK